MEKEKQQELYDQHKRLIEAEVWRACRTLPDIPREELVSDAEQVFCECCQGWTPKEGKFSTYLVGALRNVFVPGFWYRYQSTTRNAMDRDGIDPEMIGINGMCGPERLVRLKQALSHMKPLAVEIVNLVFCPTEGLKDLIQLKRKPTLTKGVLRDYVRKSLGIGDATAISEAFFEIAQTLEEV
jgi:hypothetical protein